MLGTRPQWSQNVTFFVLNCVREFPVYMQFNVGVKDLISTGGDSRPSCIQMLANRSCRGTSKGDKVWHSLTLEKKMKVNKFDIASQNPGFPCPHVNRVSGGWGKLHFLWPKMMFTCGWKAKTHRIKPCFPKFPRACRQTVSKKIYSPASWQIEKVKCDMDTNRLWRSTQPGNKCQLEACLLPATKTVMRCLRRASSSGQWWFLFFFSFFGGLWWLKNKNKSVAVKLWSATGKNKQTCSS